MKVETLIEWNDVAEVHKTYDAKVFQMLMLTLMNGSTVEVLPSEFAELVKQQRVTITRHESVLR